MKRAGRHIMTVVSTGFLLVTLGLVVLWVRSHWRGDTAWFQTKKDLPTSPNFNPQQTHNYILMSGDGGICLALHTTVSFTKTQSTGTWETSSGNVRYPRPWTPDVSLLQLGEAGGRDSSP